MTWTCSLELDLDLEDDFDAALTRYQLQGARWSSIRRKKVEESLIALGNANSDLRREQMDAWLNTTNLTHLRPDETDFGDEGWQRWFMTRTKGCLFSESIKGLRAIAARGGDEVAAQARTGLDWQALRSKETFTFPGKPILTRETDISCRSEVFYLSATRQRVQHHNVTTRDLSTRM